jgi:branched-chain amino acid transport system permease protein
MVLRRIDIKRFPFDFLIFAAVLLLIPQFMRGETYAMHILILVLINSILSVSLNLLIGYTGQINLAHSSFFGIGAYSSANLAMKLGMNFWPALFIGGLISAGFAGAIGLPSLRLRGIYFAMVSFAFCSLASLFFTKLRGLTGGGMGIWGIPTPIIRGAELAPEDKLIWVYIVLGFLLLTIFVVNRLVNSRVGNALIAIREDEDLAKSTGINTMRYKVLSLMISTFFAGIAGGLYAGYRTAVAPSDFTLLQSLMVVAMCVIGGLGTMVGPVIGTTVVVVLPEALRFIEHYYYIVFSVLLIILVIRAPTGIMGGIKSIQEWFAARSQKLKEKVEI